MVTRMVTPHVQAYLPGVAEPVSVVDGGVKLDSGAVPYAQASVVVPLTSETQLEPLDPRTDTRIIIEASNQGEWTDYSAWVVAHANLMTNPRAVQGKGGYLNSGTSTLTWVAGWAGFESAARWTATGTGAWAARITFSDYYPSTTYRVSVHINASVALPASSVQMRPDVNTGTDIGVAVPISIPAGQSVIDVTLTTSAGAPTANSGFVIIFPAGAVGVTADVTGVIVERNETKTDHYFDGDSDDGELVDHVWSGAVNASVSHERTRTQFDEPVWLPVGVRTFDLGLRERTVDHRSKTVTIVTGSDEMLLMDYASLTTDTGARAFEASARAVCNYVLGKLNFSLNPSPSTDRDLTAYWELTNLMPNPTVTGGGLGTYYAAGNGTSAVAYENASGWLGTSSVKWTAKGGEPAFLSARQFTASEGHTYTASVYVRAGSTRDLRIRFNWRDSEGEIIKGVVGPSVSVPATWNSRLTFTATAPAATARLGFLVEATGSPAAGANFWADGFMLYEGNEVVPYFDGASGDTTHYALTWADGAHTSQSTRTPLVGLDREPDMYVWRPGVSAWDFLAPLLTTVNLKLFCDEQRVWRLIDPGTYVVAGNVVVSPTNISQGSDTISREDPEVFATGVVARYTWVNAKGDTVTKYDAAGTPEKVVVIDYAKPWPGRGTAANVLKRRNGSGRSQDVEGLAQWSATPGQTASISLPGAPEQQGKVTTTEWSLGDDALMRLGTAGLIDIPSGSWLSTPKSEKWTDPPDLTWEAWT